MPGDEDEADIRIEKRHAVLLKHLISEMLYRSPMQNIVTVRDRSQARTKGSGTRYTQRVAEKAQLVTGRQSE